MSADAAFNQTRKESHPLWTSGLGIDFDGIISGIKGNFFNKYKP